MNEPFSEQECRQDIKESKDLIHWLKEFVRPMIWRDFRWRFLGFLGFWCFLWLYVFHQGTVYALGTGVGTLLVLHAVCRLYLCKRAINNTKERIAHIEGYIRAHHEEHTSA